MAEETKTKTKKVEEKKAPAKKAAAKKPAKKAPEKKSSGRIAIIRIRGVNSVRRKIEDTMTYLRLYRKNYCVVVKDSAAVRGMLQRAKDYITWGEIDEKTYSLLVEKRGEEYKGRTEGYHARKFVEVKGKKLKPYFRLSPPRGGFARKGIKWPVSLGGVLGNRSEDIIKLIERMV